MRHISSSLSAMALVACAAMAFGLNSQSNQLAALQQAVDAREPELEKMNVLVSSLDSAIHAHQLEFDQLWRRAKSSWPAQESLDQVMAELEAAKTQAATSHKEMQAVADQFMRSFQEFKLLIASLEKTTQ